MLHSRRLEINALALKVRKALDLDQSPFPVEQAIARLGGQLKEQPGPEAVVQKHGEAFLITVSDQPPTRKLFSIAHELGHLFLHMGYLIDKERWDAIDEYRDSPRYRYGFSDEEYEAHEFAGALLMPEAEFRSAVHQLSQGDRTPLQPLADKFGVSVDAARTRGQWLGVFDWNR